MFLKFHGSILSEIVLSTICLEQKGLKQRIKNYTTLFLNPRKHIGGNHKKSEIKENRTHPILLGVLRIIGDTPQVTSFG